MPSARRSSGTPLRLALVVAVAACATATPRREGLRPSQGPRDPITRAELVTTSATDAYDAVRTLRGNWIVSRGVTTLWQPDGGGWPAVFVDGMRLGTIGELRSVPRSEIDEIRLLSASEASFRYGNGYAAGVILVKTRR